MYKCLYLLLFMPKILRILFIKIADFLGAEVGYLRFFIDKIRWPKAL